MTLEEFKCKFSGNPRPKIICENIQQQADTYEFLMRIGYKLRGWERNFLEADNDRRMEYRRDFQYPIRSSVDPDYVCTSSDRRLIRDIAFSDIADLIYEDRDMELPELDKLIGGF